MPVNSPPDLYGLPLAHFIPERHALVKALRGEKRRDEASEVAAMRKPSVAAWAVNQLVRTQITALRALFVAGDELAQAQAGAASGQRTADALRSATGRQRDALDDLLSAARGLLSPEGHPLTGPTLERVTDTLRAASIDGASREQVIDGCLTQELQFAGLGIGDLAAATPESPPARPATAKRRPTGKPATKATTAASDRTANAERKRKAQQKEQAAREAEAARARNAALTAARQAEAKARRAVARADKKLAAARVEQQEAAAALATAEEHLGAAATRAQETAAELDQAQRSLSDLEAET